MDYKKKYLKYKLKYLKLKSINKSLKGGSDAGLRHELRDELINNMYVIKELRRQLGIPDNASERYYKDDFDDNYELSEKVTATRQIIERLQGELYERDEEREKLTTRLFDYEHNNNNNNNNNDSDSNDNNTHTNSEICASLEEKFTGPISLEILKTPIIATDGHSYEKDSLKLLFNRQPEARSPLTRELLKSKDNRKNITLQSGLEELKRKYRCNND